MTGLINGRFDDNSDRYATKERDIEINGERSFGRYRRYSGKQANKKNMKRVDMNTKIIYRDKDKITLTKKKKDEEKGKKYR